jgi:hypothetical protein
VSVVSSTRTDPEHARCRWQIGHRVNQGRSTAVKIPNVESVYTQRVIAKIGGSQCHPLGEIVRGAHRLAIISEVPGLDSCQGSKQLSATASCGHDDLCGLIGESPLEVLSPMSTTVLPAAAHVYFYREAG